MSLKGVLSISGMSGLYKIIAQSKNSFIVESFIDQKRFPVSATQKISMLADVSVYTQAGDIALREVFLKMKEHDAAVAAISPKSDNTTVKSVFATVLPDYDAERVYVSDIQKIIKWYNQLRDKITFEEDVEETTSQDESVESKTETDINLTPVEDMIKKAKAKRTKKSEEVVDGDAARAKPVKKRAAKKKED